MDKLKKAFSKDEDEQGITAQISDATTLSWSTRIKGFIICFVVGIGMSLLGAFFLFISGSRGLILFGVFYTLGNLVALASTCFLMGPVNQIKRMFAETRIFATIVFFVMMGLTLFAAFYLKNPIVTIIFVILQFLAATWYAISYIPFARDAVKKCFGSCIGN